MSDDFTFAGWTPKPLNRDDFLTVMGGLKEGIPNLMYNLHDLDQDATLNQGTRVQGIVRLVGHQVNIFILPPLGLPPIPQTDNNISLPEESWTYTITENQIKMIIVRTVADGGITGLLHQLGVDVEIVQ